MEPSPTLDQLARSAGALANAGRWNEAEQLWQEVRRQDPRHAQALFSLGVHALKRGETRSALDLLRAARREKPADALVLMTLCTACRLAGDIEGEREAWEAALALDPYHLPALLARAAWLERFGSAAAAATAYGYCLQVAPPESGWPAPLRERLAHARSVVARNVESYGAFLDERLEDLLAELPVEVAGRWREARAILAGASRPYRSESNQLHVPRLPALPFFDRAQFPWAAGLESRTAALRDEALSARRAARDRFEPYVACRQGQPVNQWQELNHSDRWSTLHLWRSGQSVAAAQDHCPQTARALAALPMAEIDGLCPNAMFSVLAPRTRIPPHHGETNARLVAHLPLVVPPGCRLRVGFEEREWKVGETLIFDDTLEHEACNDSDEERIVLIFDVWNPLLAPAERELVKAMAAAAREYAGISREPGEPPAAAGAGR